MLLCRTALKYFDGGYNSRARNSAPMPCSKLCIPPPMILCARFPISISSSVSQVIYTARNAPRFRTHFLMTRSTSTRKSTGVVFGPGSEGAPRSLYWVALNSEPTESLYACMTTLNAFFLSLNADGLCFDFGFMCDRAFLFQFRCPERHIFKQLINWNLQSFN